MPKIIRAYLKQKLQKLRVFCNFTYSIETVQSFSEMSGTEVHVALIGKGGEGRDGQGAVGIFFESFVNLHCFKLRNV